MTEEYKERICTRCSCVYPSDEPLIVHGTGTQLCADCESEYQFKRSVRWVHLVRLLNVDGRTIIDHERKPMESKTERVWADVVTVPSRLEYDHEVEWNREAKLGGYEPGTYSRGMHVADIGWRS